MAVISNTHLASTGQKPPILSTPAWDLDAYLTGRDALRQHARNAWYAPLRDAYRAGRECGAVRPEGEIMKWRRILRACWEND